MGGTWALVRKKPLIEVLAPPPPANGAVGAQPLYLSEWAGGLATALAEVQQLAQPVIADLSPAVGSLYRSGRDHAEPWMRHIQTLLLDLDDRWQNFVQMRIDPLFGDERSQQQAALGMGLSDEEKDANRRIILAVSNIGVAWAAANVFLPLAAVNIAFSAWLGWGPLYSRSYRALRDERRLTYPLVFAGAEIATYLGGYFVPASVGILVGMVTQKLIQRTESHFRREFIGAFGAPPCTVWAVIDGAEIEVDFASIEVGDTIVLDAGQIVPVDGLVIAGLATVDQHILTGEGQPAEKGVGDHVLAATVVLAGKLYVQVEKTGTQTNAAQISAVLEQAARYRLSFLSRVRDFNDGMVLPMLSLGMLAWLSLGPWAAAAILGMGVGAIARIGGPLAMLSYLNIASRRGDLVKDARSLEIFKRVDTIVFDKTGTLTLEQPQVHALHCFAALSEAMLLTYAAAAESKQSHPIARAILVAAEERGLVLPAIEDARYEIGYGIKVRIPQATPDSHDAPVDLLIRVGSRRFLDIEGVAVPPAVDDLADSAHAHGHSLIFVAVDDQLAGAIEIAPTIRPEALQAVAALRQQGLSLYIISGDHEAPTRHMADQLGIEHYVAGVLPQDKAALVEHLKAQGRTVCFVGDGINDAIALNTAQASVSLRGATTIATDTAQVVLMGQDLRQIAFLRSMANDFEGTLNLLFGLTLIPVALVTGTTFLLHTGIYFSILVGEAALVSGVGVAVAPLHRYSGLDNGW
ncbi:MAG: HAD-IC family P-type ATPase [Oscillochloris sp.]|nr:HAD-IC family P-type ATPase [Oscillochloris sp.]